MKRILSFCLVLILALGFSACKKNQEKPTATPTDIATKTDIVSKNESVSEPNESDVSSTDTFSENSVSEVSELSSVTDSDTSKSETSEQGTSYVDGVESEVQTNSETASSKNETSTSSANKECIHDYKPATCTKPAVCKLCGKKGEKTLEHDWQEATCSDLKTCKLCGKKTGSLTDHVFVNGSCNVCGKKDPNFGSLTSHSWRILKSKRLISISFKNMIYSEVEVEDATKVDGNMIFAENLYHIDGKDWCAVDGKGVDMVFSEESDVITIYLADDDYPEEFNKMLKLIRVSKTKLRVTKCTFKSDYWKIGVGDILEAVTQE